MSAQEPSGPTFSGSVLFGMWSAASLSLPVSIPICTPTQLSGPARMRRETLLMKSGNAAGMEILPWVGLVWPIPGVNITVFRRSSIASWLGTKLRPCS